MDLIQKTIQTIQNFDFNAGKLKNIPNSIIVLTMFMGTSALLQFVADSLIELSMLFNLIPKLPFRIDFFFLTGISALLSWHTLQGIRRKEIDVTQDSTQISWLVEVALFSGDIYFILNSGYINAPIIWIRTPFLILTFINILIVTYTIYKLKLFSLNRFIRQIKAIVRWLLFSSENYRKRG
jgi:hypothetical protein